MKKLFTGGLIVVLCSLSLVLGVVIGQHNSVYGIVTKDISTKPGFFEEWQGKKVAWFGDSLTELYYHCEMVDEYFGFEGVNCGIRGAAVASYNENSLCYEARIRNEFIGIPDDVDAIFIMAGTNDWCANIPLGDKKLTVNEYGWPTVDNTTFYGACHEMFYFLTKYYPDAYILVMGSPAAASNSYDLYNEQGLTSFDYGDALCEAASMWGFSSFNIGEEMGVNISNIQDAQALMYEGLHFVDGGARMAADVIIQEISQRRFYK